MRDQSRRTILFYGDSNTYGYDPADFSSGRYPKEKRWSEILQSILGDTWGVDAQGLNGRRLPEPAYDADRILALTEDLREKDVFAIMLGTNDLLLTMDPNAERAVRKMERFLAFLTEKINASRVLIIAPPFIGYDQVRDPLYRRYYEESRRMNEGFRCLAERFGTLFADASAWGIALAADLVHFSAEGHRKFAECMAEYITSRQL